MATKARKEPRIEATEGSSVDKQALPCGGSVLRLALALARCYIGLFEEISEYLVEDSVEETWLDREI